MPLRRLVAALACSACLGTALSAGEADGGTKLGYGQENPETTRIKAELNNMLRQGPRGQVRDVELFELEFAPLALDRVLVRDRLGREQLYHYLAFRLRNRVTEDTQALQAKATRYHEVLQAIANQYADAQAQAEGVTLKVAGEEVLTRQDERVRTRKVDITCIAYDEQGSRIQLLGQPVGVGPQNDFNFADQGQVHAAVSSARIREKVEEQVGRRLLTVDEIRAKELAPYNAQKVDAEGVAEGEAYGVILFNRLNDHGDRFTIEVRGLSNKLRGLRDPDPKKGEVQNYLDMRVLRRVYMLEYARPGDEYYRDLDRFELKRAGYVWLNTFQRLDQRKSVAYARYFLDNIDDGTGKPVPGVRDEFMSYFEKVQGDFKEDAGALDPVRKSLDEAKAEMDRRGQPGQ